jgi:hypothetical protein
MFEEGFDEFWADYPRHDAKKDARKAWHQIKPSPAMRTAIHEALGWQKQLQQWQTRELIPLPATYLRGERWTDERPIQRRSSVVEQPKYCGNCAEGWVAREVDGVERVVPCGCRHRRSDVIVVPTDPEDSHGTTGVTNQFARFDRTKTAADLRQRIIDFRRRGGPPEAA